MMALPRVPINPCLNFGVPLENVCPGGLLHPGLKELFTKAYFSAHPNECLFYNEDEGKVYDRNSSAEWITTILKFGQGTVTVRLALKDRLETGRWLLPLQVPPAAPLWLIRHFLGRLPTPLIFCSKNAQDDSEKHRRKWLRLSTDCHIAMHRLAFMQKIHGPLQKRLASILDDMRLEACLILFSLITLIRNLSHEFGSEWINVHAVRTLVEYFTPPLMSRPYRPGYLTKDDKGITALLQYLCFNLPEVKALCKKSNLGPRGKFFIDTPTYSSINQPKANLGTPPALKKILIDDFRQVFSKAIDPTIQTFHPHLESKTQHTVPGKKSSLKIESEENTSVSEDSCPRNYSLEGSDQESQSNSISANKVFCNIEEDIQPSCFQKPVITYCPIIVSSITEEEQILHDTNYDSNDPSECEEKVCNSTIRKCQALKLAYKLRGQWLAWKLAGLFIDGASSPISGFGYSKLPHDLPP